MHFGKIFLLGLLLWALLLADKFFLLDRLAVNDFWLLVVFYLLIVVFSRMTIKQLGIINFLEAIFTSLVWLLIILLLDFWFGRRFLNSDIFTSKHYWLSFLTVFLSVFFLHKKRHVQIRKEQAQGHKH